jgi:hypothetical protein
MINNTKTVDIPLSTLDRNRDDDSESDDSELDEPQPPSTTEVQIDPVSYFRINLTRYLELVVYRLN